MYSALRFLSCLLMLQARASDEEAKTAIIHQLDDNLREEQRLWCQQDRELFAVLSPLQVG